jgi:hypothetical protein
MAAIMVARCFLPSRAGLAGDDFADRLWPARCPLHAISFKNSLTLLLQTGAMLLQAIEDDEVALIDDFTAVFDDIRFARIFV